MKRFLHAHATHPQWRMALGLVAAQIEAQRGLGGHVSDPTLGWVYFTDRYAPHGQALIEALNERWPGVHWVGAVGIGVAACGAAYFDEPALAVMLCDLPVTDFRVFSGAQPLAQGGARGAGFDAATALVHADPSTPDLADLIAEMSDRTSTGYLFGGLAASRGDAWHVAGAAFRGGLSGVAFGREVALLSRVTQGCQPLGPTRTVTRAERNVVYELDGAPALDCLLQDVDATDADPRAAFARLQRVLIGIASGDEDLVSRAGQFGADTRVRHLVGFDPQQRGVAVGDSVEAGLRVAFCSRDTEAARRDLIRICTEIREELEPETWPREEAVTASSGRVDPGVTRASPILGAVYVSCSGRGGPHFGSPSAELRIVQHALGDVPLVGFFAAGEIARHHLFGYTGVLTVFTHRATRP